MYSVEILQTHDRQYWLRIGRDSETFLFKAYSRLIEAENAAKALKLHVDRIHILAG